MRLCLLFWEYNFITRLLAMKLVSKSLDRGSGGIVLVPEYSEDMWHLYNLIRVGDNVQVI